MSDCQSVDPLVTPFIDGELPPADRDRVEHHLRVCAPCHSRVEAERAVRSLLRGRQPVLKGECAPVALRVRCASQCHLSGAAPFQRRWRRVLPLAAAAVVVLGVGGVFLYQATSRSARVMAAELAADHVTCFAVNASRVEQSPEGVEAAMQATFGWHLDLPDEEPGADGLQLVGSRPCLYGGGRVAHIMFRHRGEPMSLFMLPKAHYDRGMVEALGHACAIWSSGDRTFVLVSRESRADVERLAARVQPTFH
jgi:anti-sigma factor RsiW